MHLQVKNILKNNNNHTLRQVNTMPEKIETIAA